MGINNITVCLSKIHTLFNMCIENVFILLVKMKICHGDREFKKLKNRHSGRCFIVCTGPSLNLDDLELIKDEYSISMNSIVSVYDQTEWRPTYYMIQDTRAFKEVKTKLDKTTINLCNQRVYKTYKSDCKKAEFMYYYLKYGIHGSRLDKEFVTKAFNPHADYFIYDGYTVTYSAMQIAVYMGFQEIILLGCDGNLSSAKRKHFVATSTEDKVDWSTWDLRMRNAYIIAKEYCDKNNIRIINASRGGNLDVFERKELELIVKGEK